MLVSLRLMRVSGVAIPENLTLLEMDTADHRPRDT